MSKSSKWILGQEQKEKLEDVYKMGEQVGQPGQFGCAYLCTHIESGEEFAVKKVSKRKFVNKGDKQNHFKQLREEINIMQQLDHKNIIQFKDVYETQVDLFIVMEACKGGELFDRIKAKGSYSEKDASSVLKQILEGIAYLHKNNIAHCDLKPDNFLFINEDEDSPLKIIDFGMSKLTPPPRNGARAYLSHFRGTPYYVAPEVLERKYSKHCDMWSFGVIMFVTLFGYPPFHDTNGEDDVIFQKIEKGFDNTTKHGFGAHFPKKYPISKPAKNLIASCLTMDTSHRFSADEALKHNWFQDGASEKPLVDEVFRNLQEFTGKQKFKIAILEMMTTYLTFEECASLDKAFAKIDTNNDGLITSDELKAAVSEVADQAKNLEKLMEVADLDGDGKLSYRELKLITVHTKLKAKEERIWRSFAKFDLNGDGFVSPDELEKVLGKDNEEAKEIIKEVDVNSDGQISYDEFMAMWYTKEAKKLDDKHEEEEKERISRKNTEDDGGTITLTTTETTTETSTETTETTKDS